jgi:ectoine hydroxylase-related dioxygenase (phytanoyl-CoA dioxygenase family)
MNRQTMGLDRPHASHWRRPLKTSTGSASASSRALGKSETDEVRRRLWAVAEAKAAAGPTDFVPADADDKNTRLLNLINWDAYFIALSARDMVLDAARHVIGERLLLSNYSANILGPGSASMVLHADQGYVAEPWPPMALASNVGWMVDDFDAAAGATRYVPGSHQATASSDAGRDYYTLPIEGAAGSMIIMDGRVWHTSGENETTGRQRAAFFGYYTVPWIRQQVNWRDVLDDHITAQCSEDYLHLLGYASGNRELFNPGAMRARTEKQNAGSAVK